MNFEEVKRHVHVSNVCFPRPPKKTKTKNAGQEGTNAAR